MLSRLSIFSGGGGFCSAMSLAKLLRGLLIVLAMGASGSVRAAAQASAGAQPTDLVITTGIISQHYCANGQGMMALQMRLRLRYTNTGNQKLILYRGEDLFYQAKIRAASATTAGARPYEIAVLNARYLEVENEPVERPAPGRLFIILQPGASYETETTVGIGVVGQSKARAQHAILEGQHTLQLIISTWYRSPSLAEKLRQQWQRKGFLWSAPVASNEVTFNAAMPASPTACK